MKKLLLASVAAGALSLAGAANAADLRMPLKAPPPPAPVFSWSGCYVGAHWGWGWGKLRGNSVATDGDVGTTFASGAHFDNTLSGPLFGGQLGCNYQWPGSQFVIGVEGSIAGADINGTQNRTAFLFGGTTTAVSASVHTKIDEIASFTGRIGWAGTGIFGNNNVLFYVKGGWAWAHQRTDLSIGQLIGNAPTIGPFNASFSGSRDGWTVGGGLEWALSFAPQASIFVEYDYYSFGHKDTVFQPFTFTSVDLQLHPTVNTVKIGVNYKIFGGPY
jgi:outer membrane immunogenic protein